MRILPLFLLSFTAALGQIHINAGGAALTDAAGTTWSADSSFTGGLTATGAIPTGAAAVYGTKRYGDFGYAIPVPDGAFSVTLYLLENAVTAPGQRVFTVTINGTPVLLHYDVAAEAGANVPVRKTFLVSAANGTGIRIQFTTETRSAFVNAIDVLPAGLSPTAKALQGGDGIQVVENSERVVVSLVWPHGLAYSEGTKAEMPSPCKVVSVNGGEGFAPGRIFFATDTAEVYVCTSAGWEKL